MPILEFLGLAGAPREDASPEADVIRHIVGRAGGAARRPRPVPSPRSPGCSDRAAHADSHVSDDETRKMEDIVRVLGHLPEAQAVLVVEMAKHQVRLFGGTQNYVVTREFRNLSTPEQRIELLECVFAVSAADESITVAEEGEARKISTELGLDHAEFVRARAAYVEHLEALKTLRGRRSTLAR